MRRVTAAAQRCYAPKAVAGPVSRAVPDFLLGPGIFHENRDQRLRKHSLQDDCWKDKAV